MSFTKKPTNPITTNPIAVRKATFVNSETTKKRVFLVRIHKRIESKREKRKGKERWVVLLTFAIGLVAALDEANAVLRELSQWIEY